MQKLFKRILVFIIFSGIIISLINLCHNRSLWLDEAMLSLNIISKSYSELLQPLELNQIAPIGFLITEKFIIRIIGNHDWALRIFPFLSFIVSIPLFYLTCIKFFKSKNIALVSCAIFSLNFSLLYYSGEVKQYSIDVLVTIAIVLAALYIQTSESKAKLIVYAIVGVVSIWFSNIAVIILFSVGLFSFYINVVKNNQYKLLIPISLWLISFFSYYFLFILDHPSGEFMLDYWGNDFLPRNIFSSEFYFFIFSNTKSIYRELLVFGQFWIIPFIVSMIGVFFYLKTGKILELFIIIFPIILHLILSSFELYPFSKRLILYLLPFIIMLFTFGLFMLYESLQKRNIKIPIVVLIIPVLFNFYPLFKNIPFEKEELKMSLEYIDKNIDNNDKIYVYYNSVPAFLFYKENYFNISNKNLVVLGNDHKDNWSKYDREILKLTGRTWLIFSHIYPYHLTENNEENYIVAKLASNGYNILNNKGYKGSSLYLVSK